MDWSLIMAGAGASAGVGAATGMGALPMLFLRRLTDPVQDTILGFAAGVMLAASFFSLILPGLKAAQAQTASRPLGAGIVIAAVLLGALCLGLINRYAPLEHFVTGRNGHSKALVARI